MLNKAQCIMQSYNKVTHETYGNHLDSRQVNHVEWSQQIIGVLVNLHHRERNAGSSNTGQPNSAKCLFICNKLYSSATACSCCRCFRWFKLAQAQEYSVATFTSWTYFWTRSNVYCPGRSQICRWAISCMRTLMHSYIMRLRRYLNDLCVHSRFLWNKVHTPLTLLFLYKS